MVVHETDVDNFLGRRNTFFTIPDFQRQYSWRRDNCATFMEDFEEALDNNKSLYLGTIFFQQSPDRDKSIIIDGQQRITTILLMLTAIFHLVSEDPQRTNYKPNLAKRIKQDFLINEDATEINRVKLKSVTHDEKIFKQIFNNEVVPGNEKSNLFKAYFYFYETFKKIAEAGVDLYRYIEGLRQLKIISIGLDYDDNLQKIFEGINSTGVALEEGDKIRNFALMLPSETVRNVVNEQYWSQIEEQLVDARENINYIADFFRKFLIANMGQDIKEREIYSKFKVFFKERVNDSSDVAGIKAFYDLVIADLERYLLLKIDKKMSHQYQAFYRPIFRISYLNIEVVYPFLMCVLKDYEAKKLSEQQVKRILAITESYLARRTIIQMNTTGLNKLYHVIYKDIATISRDNGGADYVEVYAHILRDKPGRLRFPTKQYLKERFTDTGALNNRSYHFILSSPDDFNQPKESLLLERIHAGLVNCSIEHVMPKTLTAEWRQELGADYAAIHEKYLDSLANITLTGYNSEYSNKSFQVKKNHQHGFKNSPFKINHWIGQQDSWNEDTLKARIDWWLTQIERIWPLPETDFKPIRKDVQNLVLADIEIDLTNTKPVYVSVQDEQHIEVAHWWDVLRHIIETAYQLDEHLMTKLESDSRTTKWISLYPEEHRAPVEIADSGYHVETNSATNDKIYLLKIASDLAGINQASVKIAIKAKPLATRQ